MSSEGFREKEFFFQLRIQRAEQFPERCFRKGGVARDPICVTGNEREHFGLRTDRDGKNLHDDWEPRWDFANDSELHSCLKQRKLLGSVYFGNADLQRAGIKLSYPDFRPIAFGKSARQDPG